MIFITGPLYSGKREYARLLLGCTREELAQRAVWDVQELAAGCGDLAALAQQLARNEVVIATEVGGGVVPVDKRARRAGGGGPSRLPAGAARGRRGARVLRYPGLSERSAEHMKVYLLRHGQTEYNVDKRYQGTRDIPLSEKGRAALRRADIEPDTVYVSPLCRAVDTARVLFPAARLVPVHDLREMCFGIFEGRNYVEMERDPDYLAWVGDDCMGRCPGGESRAEFSDRTCAAFASLVDEALARGAEMLVVMAHGGTQMAVMERYACPRRDYYTWCAGNAAGFILDAARWQTHGLLDLAGEACYAEEA